MRLEFHGVVSIGDAYRVSDDDCDIGAIHIGDVDVVDEIAEEKWNGKTLKVTLDGTEIANGQCVAEFGWGYSEWTPIDPDVLYVGECNLISELRAKEGKSVVLVVDDCEG